MFSFVEAQSLCTNRRAITALADGIFSQGCLYAPSGRVNPLSDIGVSHFSDTADLSRVTRLAESPGSPPASSARPDSIAGPTKPQKDKMICSKVLALVSGSFLWLGFLRYSGPPRIPPERALSSWHRGTAVSSLSVAKVQSCMSEACTPSVYPIVHNKLHTSLINPVFHSMCLRSNILPGPIDNDNCIPHADS